MKIISTLIAVACLYGCGSVSQAKFSQAFNQGFNAANASNLASSSSVNNQPTPNGLQSNQKVYQADECIGPIIMGECKGTIIEKEAHHPTCHGDWLAGQCTGPLF